MSAGRTESARRARRCCSCTRTSRCRRSGSSTSSGGSIRRARRRRRCRTRSRSCASSSAPDSSLTRPTGYVLELDADQLDLTRFERLVRRRGRQSRSEQATLLREALGLWHGPPLADLESRRSRSREIHRLEDLRLGVLEERIAADLDLGADAELVAEIEALVRAHPLRERLRGAPDARALPVRPAGRGARGLSTTRAGPRRGARDRARARSSRRSTARSSARSARSSGSRRPRSRTTTTR